MTFLFLLISNWVFATNCVPQTSAWYDIGSGSSKVLVIESNSCQPKVYKKVFSENIKVDYKQDLLASIDKFFSSTIEQAGIEALMNLKNKTLVFKPTSHTGVATAAFREAQNGQSVLTKIAKKTDIKLKIISQQEEAELAYWASNPKHNKQHVAFDIGGGSFQITFQSLNNSTNALTSIKGQIASVSFLELLKKHVYTNKQLKQKNYSLTLKQMSQARKILQNELKKYSSLTIPAEYRSHITGVGGVFNKSIKPIFNNLTLITKEQLDQWLIKESSHLKFTGKVFEDTIISNVILVSELMSLYEINTIYLSDFELAEGLFIIDSSSDQRK